MTSPNGAEALQTTVDAAVELSGVGIHSGREATVRVVPAGPGYGVRFHTQGVEIPALASHVVGARRCTSLGAEGARVDTVEHLLSALYGLGIDNALVEVDGPEIPILDGSARPWVEAFRAAGIVPLDAPVRWLRLREPVFMGEGATYMVATPADSLRLSCVVDFDHPLLGRQFSTSVLDPDAYACDVAPARTFGFEAEIKALLDAGLALGGTLDNALVVYDDHYSQELRVPNECGRHKLLDMWGDLALVGGRLLADVVAIKPGHRANTLLAGVIADHAVAGA